MDAKEMKLEKVKKSVGTTAKVLKVLRTIMIVCMIIAIVGSVICFALHEKIDAAVAEQIAQNGGSFDFDELEIGGILRVDSSIQEVADQGYYGYAIGATCIYGAVVCLIFAIFFKIFGKIFNLIQASETPFEKTIMDKLKKSFIGLVVITVVFLDPGIAVIMALVLWCVYTILDYGCALQQQSDETL